MRRKAIIVLWGTFLACKPNVHEPIDEEAYALCEALYDHLRSCGDDVEDDAAEHCAENSGWEGPCRELKVEQFECYTDLDCHDEEPQSAAFLVCEEKLEATGVCRADHRDDQ